MAGEIAIINPRHRRRRRKAARARTHSRRRRRSRRRRAVGFAYSNPRPRRRRRRGTHRRRHHARRRHNPRGLGGFKFFGLPISQAATATAGVLGVGLLTPQLLKMLPPGWTSDPKTAPLINLGAKAAVTIGGAMLIRRVNRGLGNAWALGGTIAILIDVATAYVLPALKLGDYAVGDYGPGNVSNYLPGGSQAPEEIGGGENMYADTMYGY